MLPRTSAPQKEQKISITGSSGLSKEEIERMQKEAEAHAEGGQEGQGRDRDQEHGRHHGLPVREAVLKELGDKISEESHRSPWKARLPRCAKPSRAATPTPSRRPRTILQAKFSAVSEELYKRRPPPRPAPRPRANLAAGGEHHESEEKPKEKKLPTARSLMPTSKWSTRTRNKDFWRSGAMNPIAPRPR